MFIQVTIDYITHKTGNLSPMIKCCHDNLILRATFPDFREKEKTLKFLLGAFAP